jgi:hypothetical protein
MSSALMAAPRSSGDLALTLKDGVSYLSKSGQPSLTDLMLGITVRDGAWSGQFLGATQIYWSPRYAQVSAYSKADPEGQVVGREEKDGRIRATLRVSIPRDMWGTGAVAAEYIVELTRNGDVFEGTYTGATNGRPVKGAAMGKLEAPFNTPVKDYAALRPLEHPRLAFRKSDLPELRRRAKTPEGQAMVARLQQVLGGKMEGNTAGHHAAGHGLMWLITEDPKHAEGARDIVEKVMFGKGVTSWNPWQRHQEKERHVRAPLAVGMALAFDFCYDAWPEDFRRKVATALEAKAREMIEGAGGQDEYNDNYPSNHLAICQGAGGVAAMALVGEPGEWHPKPMPPAANVEATVEAPADYTPGKGVPVVKLALDKMPTEWLFAGPLKPESMDRDFLADLGGREKARPEEGTKVMAEGRTVAFERLDPKVGIMNSKHTGNVDSLALVMPINRDYHSTVYYYTVLENDEPRFVQYLCQHGGTRAFLAGQELPRDGYLRLGKGKFPLLLQVGVGETTAWGQLFSTPRFVAATEDSAKQAMQRYERELADWEAGRKAWEAGGKGMPNVSRLVRLAAWRMRQHVIYSTGDKGWYNEGEGYSRYANTVGTLPFEVAYVNVMGEYFGGGRAGHGWYVPLWATRLLNWDGKPTMAHHGPGGAGWSTDVFRSGDFPLGFALVWDKYKAACKWVFDRFWGLEGDKTFGITEPHQAAYILAHYPFAVEAKNPEGILPKALFDTQKGFVQFRNQWRDSGDFVASIYGKSEPTGGGWSFADGSSIRIFGLGTMWVKKGGGNSDGGQNVESVVSIPGTNGWLGGQVTHFQEADWGGVVSMDTSDIYLCKPDGGGGRAASVVTSAPAGLRLVENRLIDFGIRGLRSLAADYSGKCGAPGLFVLADRISIEPWGKLPKGEPTWQLHVGGEAAVDGNKFVIKGRDGAALAGTFITPGNVKLSYENGMLSASGREFLVVMTVQKGAAPAVKIEGVGLEARLTVGQQRIVFDGKKLVLGE